jgi:hypothetical protein
MFLAKDFIRRTYKTLCKCWVAWCNSSLVVFAQVMVFAIAQAPKFKSYFWKPKISLTFYGWPWLGLRNLEHPCWKAAELLQLQLSFLAELDFTWVELLQLKLSWTSAELSFLSYSWAFSSLAELQLQMWTSLTIHQLNLPPGSWAGVFNPKLSSQDQLNWSWGAVQLVSDPSDFWPTVCQSDWQTGCQRCKGRFNRSGQPSQTAAQSDSQTGRQSAWPARGGSIGLQWGPRSNN